jgi:P2 family phage contractile tail tube protein
MAMPRKLKNFNIFNDANSYQGIAKNITLPALARKMEPYRGGGMNGPVEADMGLSDDGIQVEWTLGGWDLLAIRQWGATSASAVALRFTGAVQQDDTGATLAVEVVMRGRHKEIDFGNAEPGGDTEHSITTTCTYYKLSVDGEVLVEIDILNMVEIVNGDDILADQRAALGI